MKRISQAFLLLFVLFQIISCTGSTNEPELVLRETKIRGLESRDHRFCMTQSSQIDDDSISDEVYWKCRKVRYEKNKRKYDSIGKNVGNVIDKKIETAYRANISKFSKSRMLSDHEECEARGFVLNSSDIDSTVAYYRCRDKLISDRISPDPDPDVLYKEGVEAYREKYGKSPKLKKATADVISSGGSFPVSKIVYEKAIKTSDLVNKYPACAKYKIETIEFNECVEAKENMQTCIDEIPAALAKKELNDKIFCKKQAVIQYPDDLAVYTEEDNATNLGPKVSKNDVINMRKIFTEQCIKDKKIMSDQFAKEMPAKCRKIGEYNK